MQMGHVIMYALRQLKTHEANYPTCDLKLGPMVFSFKIWRDYLYRVRCTIFTDHKSFRYLTDLPNLNVGQPRLLDVVNDCDCEILYHLGKANVVVDALICVMLDIWYEVDSMLFKFSIWNSVC